VRRLGPYRLQGDKRILTAVDALLRMFVEQGRMKLGKGLHDYQPCYQVV